VVLKVYSVSHFLWHQNKMYLTT